jgi:small multidrug resistance pump
MAWLLLALAIVVEIIGTLCLRASDGFSRPAYVVGTAVGYGAAFYLLALVLRDLHTGSVYAIWSGIGTAALAIIGVIFLSEPLSALRMVSIALVIVGTVGLGLSGATR